MTTKRMLAAVAGAGILLAAVPGIGNAADTTGPAPLTQAERAAATQAATSSSALNLAGRVAEKAKAQSAPGKDAPASETKSNPGKGPGPSLVSGTTTQVNVLQPEFVTSGRGPVGALGYVANTVRVGDQVTSVWSVKDKGGSGWKAVNAASGDLEAQYNSRAQGGQVLHEPQVNAWYSVKGDRVLPLNDEARANVGEGVSLKRYQEIVHGKYANKLPGSDYDKSGAAGGFETSAAPAAAATSANSSLGVSATTLALGGVGALGLVAVVGTLIARRRTTH
ncbi:hypothetical protein [Dermatophilus congolensis]|uniref:hypothetical protein n=1 Tax=Dermatophilus congolensis TaxID=1863 RepID=UPI001AAF4AB5|nr:hypothetical protein [Dermatophilus congolensis]MBO3141331.1 hypothetical protein [Dermatophilus congolensis]MBO3144628.1 hypothetical protein [Dermatophilus congolensis]MBO3148036.1 hypothetical protein [Dermatophilus congolensis]MBO3150316.1 hypothetical protein [Dermatophilus congolensis]MBO3153619.1 hypothetical protein [Dermatophilus congolensis]